MNWLDLVLVIVVGLSAYMGLKIGLIRAAFTALGVLVGTILGGQLSDDIGGLIAGVTTNSSIATVVSYAVIITICLAVAGIAASIVRKVVNLLFMGWADKLGGGALGVGAGAVIAAAMIMGMANLTYSSEVGDEVANKVLTSTLDAEKTKKRLEDGLTKSSLVEKFIEVVDTVPASTLWFVPSNFRDALDVLSERRTEAQASAQR